MDPGNYGTDLAAGSAFKYGLVWAVWLASGMAMLLQYLSGKLGIASGKSLAGMVKQSLRRRAFVIPYWLAAESAAASTDLAEYLGTVIALNLLPPFFGLPAIPLVYAAIIGALDVLLIMTLMTRKFHIIDQFFMLFTSIRHRFSLLIVCCQTGFGASCVSFGGSRVIWERWHSVGRRNNRGYRDAACSVCPLMAFEKQDGPNGKKVSGTEGQI